MVKRGKAYATKTGAAINVQVARYFGEFAAYDDKKTGRDLYIYAENTDRFIKQPVFLIYPKHFLYLPVLKVYDDSNNYSDCGFDRHLYSCGL